MMKIPLVNTKTKRIQRAEQTVLGQTYVGKKILCGGNIYTVSADEIVLGSTVTVNVKAVLGNDGYTYTVLYKQKTQSKWTTKQDFGTNATVSVKPAQAADYDICIKVKDKDGMIAKKYFAVTVTK